MEEFNAIVNEILKDSFTSINPLRYGKNIEGFYLGFNSEKKLVKFKNGKKVLNVPGGIYGQTILNVNNKLRKRYMGDGSIAKEDLSQDCLQIAIYRFIESLLAIYTGQLKVSGLDICCPPIKSKDIDEIEQILNEETKEERAYRREIFLKLLNLLIEDEKAEDFKGALFNHSVNRDFDEDYKRIGKTQCETVVKYAKNEKGKTVLKFDDIFYNSINTPCKIDVSSSGDVNVDCIDYFYGKGNLTLAEKCADNVQQTDNSTKGMYGYILTRYYDKLTDKQRQWFQYAIENSSNGSDFSFIKRGDENYPSRNCRSFRSYIIDKIYNLIENDEESRLFVTQNRQIAWKSISEVEEKIKAILSQECKETQIDMLISILNKNNKASEMITEHLLDNDLYQPVCGVITGRMSKYKFKVIYLKKTLTCLQKLISKNF